jgi:hypothetical protein
MTDKETTNVWEVYGCSARARGWDFLVCKTIKDATALIEEDMDSMSEDGDEFKVVFKKYTQAQLDEVVYE